MARSNHARKLKQERRALDNGDDKDPPRSRFKKGRTPKPKKFR
jgi:hypothetical protein